jgi:hypothetical protein
MSSEWMNWKVNAAQRKPHGRHGETYGKALVGISRRGCE